MVINRKANTSDTKKTPMIMQHFTHCKLNWVLIGFVLLCFYPLCTSWYYGDDMVSYQIHTYMEYENKNIFQYIAAQMKYYILTMGRFYPVHILQRFLTFFLFNTIWKYRFFILIMNAAAIFSFAWMAKVYTRSNRLFYLILLLYPGIFLYFTRYDDAITSYFMFVQMLVIYLSLSLLCLKYFIKKALKRYLLLSLFFFMLSLLTYESSYLFVLVYPLAAFYTYEGRMVERLRKALWVSAPFFATALVCFFAYVFFSLRAVSDYQGIQFNLEPRKVATTFLKQFLASFPIVPHLHILFNAQWKYHFDWKNALLNITVTDTITTILFILLLLWVYGLKEKEICSGNKKFLFLLSILLVLCPNLMIGLSLKYQDSLTWGAGYLTTYITRFGLLLLGYLLYDKIRSLIRHSYIKTIFHSFLIILLVSIHLFSLQGNRNVLVYKNQTTTLRLIAEEAVGAGLLDGISDHSVLLLGNIWYDYPSFTRDRIFSNLCHARIRTDTMTHFIKTAREKGETSIVYNDLDPVYYFHFMKYLSNTGFAYSGKLETVSVNESTLIELFARDFKLFYSGQECSAINIRVYEEDSFITKQFPLVRHGYSNYMIEIPGLVDLHSLELVQKVNISIWQK